MVSLVGAWFYGVTSCKGSCFGHRTLLAIIVGSRQMVSYACIKIWGFRKGPMAATNVAYPKTNCGIQGNRSITP
jgi:hypothetical protein